MDYVICTTPRTRSTVLCDLLVSSDIAGYPREYHEEHESLSGIQVMYREKHIVEKFIDFKKVKCIWLRRENKIKQAISLLKAAKRNCFHETNETRKDDNLNKIKITNDEIIYNTFELTAQDMSWGHYFQENQINPLTIWYKELETEVQQKNILKKVLRFLRIHDTPVDPKIWSVRQDTKWDKDLYNQIIKTYLC